MNELSRYAKVLGIACLCSAGCDPESAARLVDELSIDYSIEADGQRLAAEDLDGNVEEGPVVVTDLENPPITGRARLARLEFVENDRGVTACCGYLALETEGGAFVDSGGETTRAFVSIPQATGLPRRREAVYRFEAPAFRLPADGRVVRLSLREDKDGTGHRRTRISGSLRLREDVLVLPVHVHVFKHPSRALDVRLSPRNVRAWFDPPNIETSATTVANAALGTMRTELRTEGNSASIREPIYLLPDHVFRVAGVQFRMASYEVIENAELEGQIVSGNAREFLPASEHASRRSVGGIHVYIGRNGANINLIAGATQGPGCLDSTNPDHAIALAWDTRDTPSALAHELGHYLGLAHVDEPSGNCGRPLLDSDEDLASNLMRSVPGRSDQLSQGQIRRVRAMACAYLSRWGIASSACQ